MALTIDPIVKYIPEYKNERKLHDEGKNEDPITIHIELMNGIDYRSHAITVTRLLQEENVNIEQLRAGDIKSFDDKTREAYEKITILDRALVEKYVKKIDNLKVGEKAVEIGADLYTLPGIPAELIQEIELNVSKVNRLNEDEVKN